MDMNIEGKTGNSLQISSEVIKKIAKLAALEIEGVSDVTLETNTGSALLGKLVPKNPVRVEMKDDVADITIAIVVRMGAVIPDIAEKVQKNVKSSVQNMTQISVAKVDIVVVGIAAEEVATPETVNLFEEE